MRIRNILLGTATGLSMAIMGTAAASASGVAYLNGYEFRVDTLFHNVVGPGTTQTSLLFTRDGAIPKRVFYCIMDMTNPWLTLGGVCATDNLAGKETISGMAQRKSRDGAQYFVGINGDFFLISGQTSRGVNMAGTPYGPTVVDGQIFRARADVRDYKSFTQSVDGNLYVNPISYGGTVTNSTGESAVLGGVNIDGLDNYIPVGGIKRAHTLFCR